MSNLNLNFGYEKILDRECFLSNDVLCNINLDIIGLQYEYQPSSEKLKGNFFLGIVINFLKLDTHNEVK